jgi:hypothetical protein
LEGLQPSEAEATTTPCSRFGQFVYSIGNRPVGECLMRKGWLPESLEQICPDSAGPFIVSILVGFAIFAIPM